MYVSFTSNDEHCDPELIINEKVDDIVTATKNKGSHEVSQFLINAFSLYTCNTRY